YPTYVNSRGRTSATDADEDIALSLCMAAKEWGSAWNTDAVNYVTYLMNDFKPGWLYGDGDIYLTAGVYDNGPGSYGAWGGYTPEGTKAGFNPSYFTPAYYPIFNQVVPNALWSTLAQTMWQQFAIISGTANKTGLFPDWCDTSTGQCIQTILCSDFGAQSYNFYYDAVRVPWRMATAASWNNDLNGFTYAGEAANFFKTPFYGTTGIAQYGQNIVDGYFINGTGLVPSYEGITMYSPSTGWAVEGVDHNPPVFTAMIGASTLPYGDIYYANSFYSNIVANKTSYSSPYGHYFANTLRLLSLLYMSGEMINLYDAANTNSITTNIIPGLINAEDCVGTNGHNYLTNIGSENGLGTNNTSLAYDFYVNNTLSTYQYSVYNLTYRVESTIALYPPSYGPETPTQVYILVDGTIQGAVVVAGTSGAWMTFNSTCLLTPGVHRITVATTRYGLNFGSMQFSFLNGAVIQSISSAGTTIDFTKHSLKGAQINANSPVYLTTDCYDYPQQQVDYAIVMPGVPGTAASSHTLDFWYETYIQSSISSSMNSANTSFTTLANLPQNQALVHTNITVSLNPGLQDLRISGEGLILSNLIIH
ncbi:MAG: glycosyl hydrolase family 8, partial [Brevinematales bacterium]